ncbi:hypothetical protein [Clostridium beijerinckii]|uniref:hypothetical protein n=1 Tax=Clostridium beijerinckii TaxID=1520 RepID=UPI00047ECD55|nr:hypothetical protein [Clostridium beijerinckii]
MNSQKFIFTWEKTQEKGIALYIFKYVILIVTMSVIGKVIGDYIGSKTIFKTFSLLDYVGLLFICFIGILIGLFSWNRNRTRYKESIKIVNSNK